MAYWVYENTVHKKARIHTADCSFCGSGRGIHGGGKTASGNWYGPFPDLEIANTVADQTEQSDVRACNLCIGNVSSVASNALEVAGSKTEDREHFSTNWNDQSELNCSLSLRWSLMGRLSLDDNGRVIFPDVESTAGLYRFSARYPDGRLANYIGESENLRRRFGNYRNPGPTQRTSLRINCWLKELLNDEGEILIAVAESATLNGQKADLVRKSARRMFEQMAITLEHAEDVESLNR